MKAIILALLVVAAFTATTLSNIAISPLPAIIKGTSSKFYLDGKASTDYLFKVVSTPDFVQIGTDGLLACDAKTAGAWPVEVKLYDKKSGDNQARQYILRVLDTASEDKIWAYSSDNYYERNSTTKSFRVVAGDAPSSLKVGNNF